MSMHGRVILARMTELIGQYESGNIGVERLVDDLRVMYESLEPGEQPDERRWMDAFIPLDRLAGGGTGRDRPEIQRRVERSLGDLRALITSCRTAA